MQQAFRLSTHRLLRKGCPRTPTFITLRKLWTARTIIADTPEDLITALPSHEAAKNSSATLFTISRNVPADSLSKVVTHFQEFPAKAVGCLSYGNEEGTAPFTLSYAIHQPPQNQLELVVPFRSSISGTPKIALGREVSRMEKKVHDAEWAGDASIAAEALPEGLSGLDPASVTQVIYFTDEQPQGLMKSLDTHIPQAKKAGLLASSTPFVTGRPHTLVYGSEVLSSGAVGLAICRYPNKRESNSLDLDFGVLNPLGDALEVTSSKGNIILELASTNATKLLLERIQHNIGGVVDKEQGFYLAILPEGQVQADLREMDSVRPILAGDPSRGALSLDTEANIRPGQHVQIFHAASDTERIINVTNDDKHPTLHLSKYASSQSLLRGQFSEFFALSEHGFTVGVTPHASWICSVEGSSAKMVL